MEVRCGSCNKLFRVSDDKITGKGIRFKCTRCDEYVRITREVFENYKLAQSTVSVLDIFEPKSEPSAPDAHMDAVSALAAASDREGGSVAEAAAPGPKTEDVAPQPVPDFLQEREEAPSAGAYPFEESTLLMEQPSQDSASPGDLAMEDRVAETPVGPAAGTHLEPQSGTVNAVEMETERLPVTEPEEKTSPEPALEKEPVTETMQSSEESLKQRKESASVPAPEPEETMPELVLDEPAAEAVPEVKLAIKPVPVSSLKSETGMPTQPRPATAVSGSPGPPVAGVKKDHPRYSGTIPARPVREPVVAPPARSGRLFAVILAALIVLGVAGVGAYLYTRSLSTEENGSEAGMVSAEGLQVNNPVGSVVTNGDLLISGEVENTSDRERAEWYIVVEVYDGKGTVLNKIRMLNGKQIYTRRDYDILEKRGANRAEMKEKALQTKGIVLPPKGKAPFEIRYLQPPDGIASFNVAPQPFNPAQLQREITEETK